GQPLAGVSITEKGTANGVVTDSNGSFSITVQNEQSVLVFSFIGFEQQEISVSGQTRISIVLKERIDVLDEIVVIGYGTQKKRDVTGAESAVSSEDIGCLPVANAGEAVQGRASGVQVVSAGAPGSNVTLRLRGIGTINNSDPLLVIDGVPTDVPLN